MSCASGQRSLTYPALPQAVMDSTSAHETRRPSEFYSNRLHACAAEAAQAQRRHVLLGYLRLLWALAVLALAYGALRRHAFAWEWMLLPCLGFALTARWHAAVLRAGARSQRLVRWYEHGLARVEDRWAGLQPRITHVETSQSLYAADLDLFGDASVFELLCTARTTLGEDTLARWLLQPAARAEVLARQTAVAELGNATELREGFAGVAGPPVLPLDEQVLAGWGERKTPMLPRVLRWLAPLLAVLTLAAGIRWAIAHSPLLLLPLLLVNASITFWLQRHFKLLFAETQQAAGRLTAVAALIRLLEQTTFQAPRLQALQRTLRSSEEAASQAIQRLARLAGAAEQRSNMMVRLLDFALLYSVQLGFLMQAWRERHGSSLRLWLGALGEFEALLSLSAYHFEHPADPFPELVSDMPTFVAEALGHPLLPEARCVRNSVALDETTHLLLVSGSNMSGKSTLLRSVGVNAVLAMAGAPARAAHLRLSVLHLAASLQINDSLQSGRSHFYAEILRLRAVCDLARTHQPVLFLLDELLAGTNSHDRLAGATGVVHELLRDGAIGLLSTHDLALTAVNVPTADLIHNVHFEDQVRDGKLVFDYKLREGVVTRSNGLALMRLIGLDV